MSDDAPDIPPALVESEWDTLRISRTLQDGLPVEIGIETRPLGGQQLALRTSVLKYEFCDVNDVAALAALCNEFLRRMDDPRAFTRKTVKALRMIIEKTDMLWDEGPEGEGWPSVELSESRSAISEFADALESMLPPPSLTERASN
jgi:hypothetical protein